MAEGNADESTSDAQSTVGEESEKDPAKRYEAARLAYKQLLYEDFPDFDPEEALKQTHEEESDSSHTAGDEGSRPWTSRLRNAVDLNHDGTVGIEDAAHLPKALQEMSSWGVRKVGEVATHAVDQARSTAASFDASEVKAAVDDKFHEATDSLKHVDARGIATGALRIGQTATGVQGFRDRREAKEVMGICQDYYDAAQSITEEQRKQLNYAITDLGEYRIRSLHATLGRFLQYLKALQQRNAIKEYEILEGASIDTQTLKEMKDLDMAASQVLQTTVSTTAFGAIAVFGTPALVQGTVAALATASTGTAISGLSGAAATNATLAWLGGGSLAAGGGGVAAGTIVLTTITAGTTAVVALLSAGTIVSAHYSKKLTEAKEYEKNVGITVASLEKAWTIMDGVAQRVSELRDVTEELRWRTAGQLDELERMIPEFDFNDQHCVSVFNSCGRLVKTMVELSQTPLFDEDGNLSDESLTISGKVHKVLNTEI